MINRLNYHHLRYFREVAIEGHLGQAAARLNVAQSALSVQIRQLEDRLGVALFERIARKLVLTEEGRIVLDHADQIFKAGDELLATLQLSSTAKPVLRIGAISTLSRNFQLQFLRPLLGSDDYTFSLTSGQGQALFDELETLSLDVVLSTHIPENKGDKSYAAQLIAQQPVRVHGSSERLKHPTLAHLLAHEPLIVPTESVIQTGFENLVARLGIQPNVVAHVDDMAMVRLLAREGVGLAIAPTVVLADEIQSGLLTTAPFDLGIFEPFYAITVPRRFPHPALMQLLTDQLSEDQR
ncbi:LysR family transcriptional regulator [Planktotalea sp.]|uniref:LysR family transcriptional regulator n=1 Tax=Planktotalea sp. TaxID=2029877 RepID=UPI003F6A6223